MARRACGRSKSSVRHRNALHDILRTHIRTAGTAHWIARLEQRDLLCAPVKPLGEALADPQSEVNGMVVRHDELGLVGSPVHLSAGGFALRHAPPPLGADGEAVLAEFGFSRDEIDRLLADRVIA